ncbi:carboxypeptidase-like regulatory domain-containing protein [Blastopirellula sp. J2-11]|uniref:carboxypeptidase-like regulatory domain-containing protein n=1 Tax=Blastopirellula sp. J2-11 TaxID=2943192 RepID=UPI0021C5F3C5|nr:carboxypeptidase-like regulatory domain-containing protein [Blastopirellula sp. J2-11]UUO04789.1 carboxypeptidase-like regulatory domain-containing protein [Blastopirellula sp. J2-11]
MKRNAFLLGLALLLTTGCFGSSGPQLGKVHGTVTLDGQPLAGAIVAFDPAAGGRTSEATTDAEGHFQLQFAAGAEGALLGEHSIRIHTFQARVLTDNGKVQDPGVPEKVPAKYNDETELKRTIERGENNFDFDLDSSQ